MKTEIFDLRQYVNLKPLAEELNRDELKEVGIFVDAYNLLYNQMAPWIRGFVLFVDGKFAAYASINIAELRFGRGVIDAFYITSKFRNRKIGYDFYNFVLCQFTDCHRVTTTVKATNDQVAVILQRMGWKIEGTLRNYDMNGDTCFQMSLSRAGKVKKRERNR